VIILGQSIGYIFRKKASDYWNFLLDYSAIAVPVFLAPNNERIAIFEDIMTHIEMSFNDDNGLCQYPICLFFDNLQSFNL
jgi:hypothetical protein